MDVKDLLGAVQSGGNVALVFCAYFIFKAAERLARIEKALERYMREHPAKE